jgi:hypothetical protein
LSEEADRSRGDVLVTQAFLVTDKFGKKSGSEPATLKPKKPSTSSAPIPKLPEPVQIPVPSIPSPSHPWFQTDEVVKDINKYDFSFDQVGFYIGTTAIVKNLSVDELSNINFK